MTELPTIADVRMYFQSLEVWQLSLIVIVAVLITWLTNPDSK
jgi:hypothetical protein